MYALALMILQSQAELERMQRLGFTILGALMLAGFVVLVIIAIPFWFICKKAGMSPWLSLLWLVPFGGLILSYVLAFADWNVVPAPQVGYMPPPPYPPPQSPPQPPLA
jgi:hypothetical protein